MAEANLKDAAVAAFDNLFTLWLADTLKSKTAAFCGAVLAVMPDQGEDGRPVANWATLLSITSDQMPGANVDFTSGLCVASDQVYRLCWIAYYLQQQGLISNVQANAILASYNLQFE